MGQIDGGCGAPASPGTEEGRDLKRRDVHPPSAPARRDLKRRVINVDAATGFGIFL